MEHGIENYRLSAVQGKKVGGMAEIKTTKREQAYGRVKIRIYIIN